MLPSGSRSRRALVTRAFRALVFVAGSVACARHNPEQRGAGVVYGGGPIVSTVSCPSQRPASLLHSNFRVFLGSPDATLETQTGTLIFEVGVDSMQAQGAQISV